MGEQVEAPFTWVEEYTNPSYPPLTGSKRKVKSKKKEFLGWGSKPLIEFLHSIAKDITQQISRHDVTAIINRYVNDNNLVHPLKKKRINCDDKLHALFGRKSIARNKIHNMLEPHYAENLDNSDDDELLYSSEEDNTCTNYEQQKTLTSERKTTPSKKRALETPKSCFAAIITQNVKLVYLKRSLVLDLLNDPDTFEHKIVGSFVRIKSDPNDYLQKNYYCLMLVTGIKMVPGADDGRTEILLRVANFFKDVPISLLSDDNFSEEECEDLRQRVKDGLLDKPTIVELEEKAQILHEDITKHWLVGELALLQKLIDRANEKGWRRELYEYLDRRQLLLTPAEQSRLLREVPKVIVEAIEQEAPEVIADAIEQEAPEHDSPDGIKQGNNGSQVPILKETSEIPICDIAANGISSCSVFHSTEFTGIQAALSKSKQQTEPGILLDFSMGEQQKLPTEIRNESIVVPQPVTKEENKMAEVIELSDDDDENEIPIFDFDLERLEWQYADPQGDIQGPFSVTSLKRWSDADYFPPGFKVWKTGQRPDEAVLVCHLLQWAFPNNF